MQCCRSHPVSPVVRLQGLRVPLPIQPKSTFPANTGNGAWSNTVRRTGQRPPCKLRHPEPTGRGGDGAPLADALSLFPGNPHGSSPVVRLRVLRALPLNIRNQHSGADTAKRDAPARDTQATAGRSQTPTRGRYQPRTVTRRNVARGTGRQITAAESRWRVPPPGLAQLSIVDSSHCRAAGSQTSRHGPGVVDFGRVERRPGRLSGPAPHGTFMAPRSASK
jgi:hypothetical protein